MYYNNVEKNHFWPLELVGIEPGIFQSRVRLANHYTMVAFNHISSFFHIYVLNTTMLHYQRMFHQRIMKIEEKGVHSKKDQSI